jgi:hypothetical protein
MAMGVTMGMLGNQWIKAVLNYDEATAARIDEAMQKIKTLPAKSCKWENTDTCRMCVAPESGRCPVMSVDVAA